MTPTNLGAEAARDIAGALNAVLADLFALYVKTKNFHWHVSWPHFRDNHLLLDEQADQIYATTDSVAERVRKIGGGTLRSIGHISRLQRVLDNDAEYVTPLDMLAELRDDNLQLIAHTRATHDLCGEHRDVATASLLEVWIDEAEKRVWFLFEACRRGDAPSQRFSFDLFPHLRDMAGSVFGGRFDTSRPPIGGRAKRHMRFPR